MAVAMVTGAGGAIGSAACRLLAAQGYRVVALDLSEPATLPAGAWFRACDVSSRASVAAAVEEVERELGEIDALVNVAGVVSRGSALDLDEAELQRVLRINVQGTLIPCQLVGRRMAGRGRGAIVNIGSVVGKNGGNARPWLDPAEQASAGNVAYGMSMFASPGFRAAALVSVAYGAGMYGSTFLIPVFMQGALGIPALTTGNILLLGGVALALSTSLAGRVVDRLSTRLVVAAGLACFALACALLAWARELAWIAVAVVLCRIGLGLVIPGLYTGMAQVVVPGGLREGTAVITLLRQGGGALGVSLIGVLTASSGSAELAGWLGLAPAGSAAAAPATVFAGIAQLFVAALGVVRRLR